MANATQIAYFTFNLPLKNHEINQWRAAFLQMLPTDLTLQQLANDGTAYPLVQFCSMGSQAAIIAIDTGIQAIQEAILAQIWDFTWQKKAYPLGLEQMEVLQHDFVQLASARYFSLQTYLPFAPEANVPAWEAPDLITQVKTLQQRLEFHIQQLVSTLELELSQPLILQLTHLERSKRLSRQVQAPTVFYLKFRSNLIFPPGIGLGEGLSHGLGKVNLLERKL